MVHQEYTRIFAPTFNARKEDLFVVFDGDQRPAVALPESGALPQGISDLRALIEKYTAGNDAKGPGLDFVNSETLASMSNFFEDTSSSYRVKPQRVLSGQTHKRDKCAALCRAKFRKKAT